MLFLKFTFVKFGKERFLPIKHTSDIFDSGKAENNKSAPLENTQLGLVIENKIIQTLCSTRHVPFARDSILLKNKRLKCMLVHQVSILRLLVEICTQTRKLTLYLDGKVALCILKINMCTYFYSQKICKHGNLLPKNSDKNTRNFNGRKRKK